MKRQLLWDIENLRPGAANLAHQVAKLEFSGMEQDCV